MTVDGAMDLIESFWSRPAARYMEWECLRMVRLFAALADRLGPDDWTDLLARLGVEAELVCCYPCLWNLVEDRVRGERLRRIGPLKK